MQMHINIREESRTRFVMIDLQVRLSKRGIECAGDFHYNKMQLSCTFYKQNCQARNNKTGTGFVCQQDMTATIEVNNKDMQHAGALCLSYGIT